VRARAADLEEVAAMLAAGENEVAADELRWLLQGCPDFVAAHSLLGELAATAGDLSLARGHFGYAYQLGLAAWQAAGRPVPLPYALAANQAFFEAGRGLADCLDQLGERQLAEEVVAHLLACDPTDPLDLQKRHTASPCSTVDVVALGPLLDRSVPGQPTGGTNLG